MKKRVFVVVLILCGVFGVSWWRNPPLKTPTPAQISAAFPNGSQTIFDEADKFVLYALEPRQTSETSDEIYFHNHKVLGRKEIADAETLQQLRASYYDSIAESDGARATCFNPRHGLRAVKNGKILDLVICFGCQQTYVFVNDEKLATAAINPKAQRNFNRIYADAGLKLAR